MIRKNIDLAEAKRIVGYYHKNRWDYLPSEYYQAIRVLEHEKDIIRMEYYKKRNWDYMSNSAFYTSNDLEKELREINGLLANKRQ